MSNPAPAAAEKKTARGTHAVYTYLMTLFISVIALILLSYFSHPVAAAPADALVEPVAVQTETRA